MTVFGKSDWIARKAIFFFIALVYPYPMLYIHMTNMGSLQSSNDDDESINTSSPDEDIRGVHIARIKG